MMDRGDIIITLLIVCVIGGAALLATMVTDDLNEKLGKTLERVEECKVNDGYYTNISTKSKVEINDLCWEYISIK